MQLGFVSAILPDLPLAEVLAAGRSAGYTSVELMCWPPGKAERRYAGVTHIDVSHFDPAQATQVLDQAAAHFIQISTLGYYPNILSPSPEEQQLAVAHLKQVIVAAKLLDVPVVSTFIGRDWHRSVEDNWPRFLSLWPPLIAFAEDHGIRIAIENCPMLFTADEWPGGKNLAISPALWTRIFEAVPSSSFGLTYDPSHLLLQHMDYVAPLAAFAPRIFRVHAKDLTLDRQRLNQVGILAHPAEYYSPKLPGTGEIDWPLFLQAVSAAGYTGPITVEVEDRRYEATLDLRKEALALSASYLKSLL